VKHEFTLLIADRNPHVRMFLQREMTAAGYRVRLADTGREVLKWAFQGEPLDLIILDPDLPDADETRVLEHLLDRIPVLPVVVHTYPPEHGGNSKDMNDVIFVEKKGSSVERLKQVVHETLIGSHSRRQKKIERQSGYELEPSNR
jgi:DNA-binding NtrC family response regulator